MEKEERGSGECGRHRYEKEVKEVDHEKRSLGYNSEGSDEEMCRFR